MAEKKFFNFRKMRVYEFMILETERKEILYYFQEKDLLTLQ